MRGAESLGVPRNADYNGRTQEGIAYAQRSVFRGRRVSPARAFLYPAMQRGNTRVITGTQVLRVIIENRKATGVRLTVGGRDAAGRTIRANREVIVCAGAMASAQILQLSGIGGGAHLQSIGVPVAHDLPGVGQNFRDHYAVRSVLRIRNMQTINHRVRGLALVREVVRYALTRRVGTDADAGLLLLEIRPDPCERRHTTYLHPGQLSGRRAVGARPLRGSDGRLLATTPDERRIRACDLVRRVPAPGDPGELSG